jgi:DNA modification methylase
LLDDKNANRGTKRGRGALAESIDRFGAGRSVLADRSGRIIAGNKTVEQAKALNLPIRVVTTDGKELVVVQRRDLDLQTDPKARELALADNRIAELDLEWDPEVLRELRSQGIDTSNLWTDAEWNRLVTQVLEPDPALNRVVEPKATSIKRGDMFGLGSHRILCGDATHPPDVARLLGDDTPLLMVTDPPYGVNYDPAWRHRAYPNQRNAVGRVVNDDQAAWPNAVKLFPGNVVYLWHAARFTAATAATLEQNGFGLRAQVIWVKQHFALSRGDYHWQHEPCWYAVRNGEKSNWQGDRTQSTVWTVPNLNPMGGTRTDSDVPTGHGTQKPARLFQIPLINHTSTGDLVYDPFVGSGTTLIAAESLGRVACVMDIDPLYVQASISRWEGLTGRKAAAVKALRKGRR